MDAEQGVEAEQAFKVKYDSTTKRVDVTCGERRISIPGKHEDIEAARVAAEAYFKRYFPRK